MISMRAKEANTFVIMINYIIILVLVLTLYYKTFMIGTVFLDGNRDCDSFI